MPTSGYTDVAACPGAGQATRAVGAADFGGFDDEDEDKDVYVNPPNNQTKARAPGDTNNAAVLPSASLPGLRGGGVHVNLNLKGAAKTIKLTGSSMAHSTVGPASRATR